MTYIFFALIKETYYDEKLQSLFMPKLLVTEVG